MNEEKTMMEELEQVEYMVKADYLVPRGVVQVGLNSDSKINCAKDLQIDVPFDRVALNTTGILNADVLKNGHVIVPEWCRQVKVSGQGLVTGVTNLLVMTTRIRAGVHSVLGFYNYVNDNAAQYLPQFNLIDIKPGDAICMRVMSYTAGEHSLDSRYNTMMVEFY